MQLVSLRVAVFDNKRADINRFGVFAASDRYGRGNIIGRVIVPLIRGFCINKPPVGEHIRQRGKCCRFQLTVSVRKAVVRPCVIKVDVAHAVPKDLVPDFVKELNDLCP